MSTFEDGRIDTVYLDNESNENHELKVRVESDEDVLLDKNYELGATGEESSETVTGMPSTLSNAVIEASIAGAEGNNEFSTSELSGCHNLLIRIMGRGDVIFFTRPTDSCGND